MARVKAVLECSVAYSVPRSHVISVASICASRGPKKAVRFRKDAQTISARQMDVEETNTAEAFGVYAHAEVQNGKVLEWSVAHSLPHAAGPVCSYGSITTHHSRPRSQVVFLCAPREHKNSFI